MSAPPGIEWFTGRHGLDKKRPLSELLRTRERIDLFSLSGTYISQCAVGELRSLHRVLLPDPANPDVRQQAERVQNKDLPDDIKASTRLLVRDHKVRVRWYPSLLFHSLLIVDPEKPDGFFHDELVLPYTAPRERPSVRFYRREYEDVVLGALAAFDRMWDAGRTPGEAELG